MNPDHSSSSTGKHTLHDTKVGASKVGETQVGGDLSPQQQINALSTTQADSVKKTHAYFAQFQKLEGAADLLAKYGKAMPKLSPDLTLVLLGISNEDSSKVIQSKIEDANRLIQSLRASESNPNLSEEGMQEIKLLVNTLMYAIQTMENKESLRSYLSFVDQARKLQRASKVQQGQQATQAKITDIAPEATSIPLSPHFSVTSKPSPAPVAPKAKTPVGMIAGGVAAAAVALAGIAYMLSGSSSDSNDGKKPVAIAKVPEDKKPPVVPVISDLTKQIAEQALSVADEALAKAQKAEMTGDLAEAEKLYRNTIALYNKAIAALEQAGMKTEANGHRTTVQSLTVKADDMKNRREAAAQFAALESKKGLAEQHLTKAATERSAGEFAKARTSLSDARTIFVQLNESARVQAIDLQLAGLQTAETEFAAQKKVAFQKAVDTSFAALKTTLAADIKALNSRTELNVLVKRLLDQVPDAKPEMAIALIQCSMTLSAEGGSVDDFGRVLAAAGKHKTLMDQLPAGSFETRTQASLATLFAKATTRAEKLAVTDMMTEPARSQNVLALETADILDAARKGDLAKVRSELMDLQGKNIPADVLEPKLAEVARELTKVIAELTQGRDTQHRQPAFREGSLRLALDVLILARKNEDYEGAGSILRDATTIATKPTGLTPRDHKEVLDRLNPAKKVVEAEMKTIAALRENAEDPIANLARAKQRAALGDWPTAKTHLAKSSSPLPKLLESITTAKDAGAMIAIGEDLVRASEVKEDAEFKDFLLSEALGSFDAALGMNPDTLQELKATSKKKELEGRGIKPIHLNTSVQTPSVGVGTKSEEIKFEVGQWSGNLINLIDPKLDSQWGTVKLTNEGFIETTNAYCKIAVPVSIEGNYDLRMTATLKEGNMGAGMIYPVGNALNMFLVDTGKGDKTSFIFIDGKDTNPSTVMRKMLTQNKQFILSLSVRTQDNSAQLVGYINDSPIIKWEGSISSLSIPGSWALKGDNRLAIATQAGVVISDLQIRLQKGAKVSIKQR